MAKVINETKSTVLVSLGKLEIAAFCSAIADRVVDLYYVDEEDEDEDVDYTMIMVLLNQVKPLLQFGMPETKELLDGIEAEILSKVEAESETDETEEVEEVEEEATDDNEIEEVLEDTGDEA